jgi:hypothetical protein
MRRSYQVRREGEEREKRGRSEGEEREKRGRREGEERETRERREGEEREKKRHPKLCVVYTVYCVLIQASVCLPSPPFLPPFLHSSPSFLCSSHQAVCELCEPSYGVDMRQRRWMSQLEETAWLVRTGTVIYLYV